MRASIWLTLFWAGYITLLFLGFSKLLTWLAG